MPPIVDCHTHVFPDVTSRVPFREKARTWIKPLTRTLHESQTFFRILPRSLRNSVDELGGLAPLAGLLFESSPRDLREAMRNSSVDYAVVIAQPPVLSNDALLEICAEHPQFIPVVNIPPGPNGSGGEKSPRAALKKYAKKGARALKIHSAVDGEGADSPHYRVLLETAAELGLPVILHTGCIHMRLVYRNPAQGNAENFAPWFKTYRDLRFILAHMNAHMPNVALDLGEKYPNVFVDTSWQPSETIGEAVRRLGAKKVLFGTDWPLIGNNIAIGIQRIRDCVETGTLTESDAKLVLGENAACLLNLPS